MNTITFREWTVSLCPRCEGTFYDESTLQALLRQPDLRLSYLRPALLPNLACPHGEGTERQKIACPECQKEMKREAYSSTDPLLVDRCVEGHGIWLDDGELGHLYMERELNDIHPTPSFFEGFRRLIGLKAHVPPEQS